MAVIPDLLRGEKRVGWQRLSNLPDQGEIRAKPWQDPPTLDPRPASMRLADSKSSSFRLPVQHLLAPSDSALIRLSCRQRKRETIVEVLRVPFSLEDKCVHEKSNLFLSDSLAAVARPSAAIPVTSSSGAPSSSCLDHHCFTPSIGAKPTSGQSP